MNRDKNSSQYQIARGQYFTPRYIADYMVGMLESSRESLILEPSSGEGVFIDALQAQGFNRIMAYEIDRSLIKHSCVKNESFVSVQPNFQFDAIIGNPPYVRWKNMLPESKVELNDNPIWRANFNGLCDYFYIFILKSIKLLRHGGELVFICPDYWISTKHATNLRKFMLKNGCFSNIIRFHETAIFDGVNSSFMIFRYIKGGCLEHIDVIQFPKKRNLKKDTSSLNEILGHAEKFSLPQFLIDSAWTVANKHSLHQVSLLEKICSRNDENLVADRYPTVGDVCDIGNGMVSGLDKAFQTQLNDQYTSEEIFSSINVAKAKHLEPYRITRLTDYIFIRGTYSENELKIRFPNFYKSLLPYRIQLDRRYNYNRNLPYWEWAFPRNYQMFRSASKRILVPCKERITNKDHFRFAIAESGIYPTQDVTALFKKQHTQESLEYIAAYLNHPAVFHWVRHKGVIKGGIVEFSEKPLSSIPFRKINWNIPDEVQAHHAITCGVNNYMQTGDKFYLNHLEALFAKLGMEK